MTTIFTPEQRQDLYDKILQQLKDDNRVTGIFSMGATDASLAGDADSINLLVIIEKPSIIDIVFTLWVKRLEDMIKSDEPFHVILAEDTHTVNLLTPHYLQITVQFRSVNRFYLVGNDWLIVFDRDQHLRDYLDKREQSRDQAIRNVYTQHMESVWLPVVSCLREIKHDNLWKAIAELNILRKLVVEVAGLRHLEFTEAYRNMDYLPEMFLVLLQHTLPASVTANAIHKSLKATLNMLFDETAVLDNQYNTDFTDQLEHRLSSYVELYTFTD